MHVHSFLPATRKRLICKMPLGYVGAGTALRANKAGTCASYMAMWRLAKKGLMRKNYGA